MKVESAFDIGDICWCIMEMGSIRKLTIGLVRVEKIDSPGMGDSIFDNYKAQKGYTEEYMCIETGIGSGSYFTLGRNIFKTEEEATKAATISA